MYRVFAPTLVSHSRAALAVNCGPLSEQVCPGTPLAIISPARVEITSGERTLRPARMARHSRVYSQVAVISRTARPSLVLIRMKS